jgi:Ca2+-binding RTX toxin-like protein
VPRHSRLMTFRLSGVRAVVLLLLLLAVAATGGMSGGAGVAVAQSPQCDLNGPSHPPDDPTEPYYCQVLQYSGEFSLGRLATASRRLDCPSYSDGFDLFNAFFTLWSSASSVTGSHLATTDWVSSTYTNWSITTSHESRTQMLCQAADFQDDYPINDNGTLLQAPYASTSATGRSVRKGESPLRSASAFLNRTRFPTARVTIDCPTGLEIVHAEGHIGYQRGAPRDSSLIPGVQITTSGATAAASASAAKLGRHDNATLVLTAVCGTAGTGRVNAGSAAGDEIAGSNAADRIRAGAAGDRVYAGAGDDTVDAGAGNDMVRAGAGDDTVNGGTGEDVVEGSSGDDTLYGGSTRDLLRGGPGADRLSGGGGNDRLDADDGNRSDRISCGAGRDTVLADRGDRVTKDCERVF